MRLHHLEICAFGPFADSARVDFDELSSGGVFLLTGATGAGKTSVLDAVCFALYGQVPGDRSGARHLRSDHAAPGQAPRVVLRLSVGNRTFRFTRSPAWSRPKQRGTGETRVPAHVLVEEQRGSSWVGLTNRLDDAGLLVGDLLGMTAAQFTQVALLPQGRFQSFLRAGSADRHAVLQKLFRTDRFEQVERWLVDRRTAARHAAEDAGQRVLEVVNRVQEAAGAEVPVDWSEDLAGAAERGKVAAWSAALLGDAEEVVASTERSRASAAEQLQLAENALEEARRIRDLQARAESSARDLVALESRGDELSTLRDRLERHRRAAPLSALLTRADDCARLAERAATRWEAARRELVGAADGELTGERLADLLRDAVSARAVAEAFRPRARQLDDAADRVARQRSRAGELAEALASLDEEIAAHPAEVAEVRASLDASWTAAARIPSLERELAELEELLAAARRRDVVVEELATARRVLAEATQAALAAKEAYLDVREARINGMAAELAGSLAAGCACPVCGSASHPAPADQAGAAVGRAEEEAARRAHEDAGFLQQNHELRVATLAAEADGLQDRLAGVDPTALRATLAAGREELGRDRALAAAVDQWAARLRAVEDRGEAVRVSREQTTAELAAARHEASALESTVAALTAELETLLGEEAPDLEALVALRADRCDRLERAVRAFASYDEASRAASEATATVTRAAAAAAFADASEAAEALLAPDQARAAESALTSADATRLAAEQVLADPETRAAVARPAPDVDVAVVKQRLAADTLRSAASGHDAAVHRGQRLQVLDARLRARLQAWEPVRADHARVAALAQLVEGKGPDNPLRIRLAAYVLSERLRQVVAAANERLSRMTGQRYSLEHTDDRGAGEKRGGLSLLVRDDWNGVSRDPATLSGGETFVVSLALALGLADTVAHEAGGTDIDTLFIDEGFGSLDSDTLEDVMDTLDTLRDGGRVVGLVSHVPELRSRITTQLEVVKGRNGSSLRTVLVGG